MMKKMKIKLCVFLSIVLVISSISLGFGGLMANAYNNYPATGVFKLEICTKDKTVMYPAPGSDSDFEFRLLNASQQILWQSGTLDTPANDFEEGNIDIFTAQNGNPALGAVPVSKDIYYFEIIETRHNDSWFMNWLDVYYLVGTEWVQVGHNGGDYELDHVGDHVMWATTWFADHAHTLDFNTNGGTNGATYDAVYGQPLTAPSTSKTGYTLTGWSPSVPAIMPDSNAAYTAQWAGNPYTVTFNPEGGTVSPSSKTVNYAGTYGTLPAPAKIGHTFEGWYTEAGGSGTNIVAGTVVGTASNHMLYAKWTRNYYNITFNANGGAGGSGPSHMLFGDPLTAPGVMREFYNFSAWSPSVPATVPAADTTYTAQWDPYSYTIVYNSMASTSGSTPNSTHDYGVAKNLSANGFVKVGHHFSGWSLIPDDAVDFTDMQSVLNLSGVDNSTVTLYAVWTPDEYEMSFDANGGYFLDTGNGAPLTWLLPFGSLLFPPAVVRDGFYFSGWSPDLPKFVPAANRTYTAQWRAAGYEAGNAFLFGEYPQSVIRDTSLLLELRGCELDESGIATYENERYLRVCFEQYTPYFLGLAPTEANSLQDNNGFYAAAEYWFKCEPIQWRVLSNINGEIFAVTETILDSRPFSPSTREWIDSTERTWLNDSFANLAFLPDELARINSGEVLIPANTGLGTPGSTATQDKLFFLSYEEAMEASYGFAVSANDDAARKAGVTDYARCMGLLEEELTYGQGMWWLRSPGFSSVEAGVVSATGSILAQDSYPVACTCIGLRPAMRIDALTLLISPIKGSGCIIDYNKKFIYGLEPGISTLDGYAAAPGYDLVYVPTAAGFGTGTIVHVQKDGVTVDSYTIIIYGDITGDGSIDSLDAGTAVDFENYLIDWDPEADAAYYEAGDVNGDGEIDSIDAGIMVDFENYLVSIDQATGLADTD